MSRIRPARQHRRARTSAPSPKLGFLQMIRHRMDIKRTLFLYLVLLAASLFVGELAAFAGFKFYATERLARRDAKFQADLVVVDDGAPPQWMPTPLEAPISVGAVLQAIEKSRSDDFWLEHNRHRPPRPRFPYLLSSFQSFAYFGFESVRCQDLWQEKRPQEVMGAIIDEFVLLSEKYSFLPILVMIPMGDDLRLRERGDPPTYAPMLGEIREQYQGRLTVVDILNEPFQASRFHVRPFQGHASQYGNRAIASAILDKLPAAFRR